MYALLYRYIICSSISNYEIAGGRPDMNIKVAVYVKAWLWHNTNNICFYGEFNKK